MSTKLAALKNILQGWLNLYYEPLRIWLVFRLTLFVLPIFAALIMPLCEKFPLPVNYPYAFRPLLDRFLGTWTRWDGGYYIDIARKGYAWVGRTDDGAIAFFPLYPHLVRAVSAVFSFGTLNYLATNLAGVMVSSVATLLAFMGLYRLAKLDYDETTSRLAVLYLAIFPMSFFFVAIYTESLFIALTIWAFWAAREKRWWWAGCLAALAVLTKNQGIIVVGALGIEYLQQKKFNPLRFDWKILSFGLPVLGYSIWLGVNFFNFGDPLRYLTIQANFARYYLMPHETLWRATELFFLQTSNGFFITRDCTNTSILYDYPITLAFIGLTLYGIFLVWKNKLPLSYLAFMIVCVVLPLLSPTKDSWLASMPRLYVIVFPAFLLVATFGKRWPIFHYIYLVINLAFLGLFVARYTLNYWVA